MAEPAQPEPGAAMSPDVKQERDILEGLEFAMATQTATKRPFEDLSNADEPPKRIKTESEGNSYDQINENQENNDSQTGAEASLEGDLALLVQNALSGVGDLVRQLSQDPGIPQATSDPVDVTSTRAIPESSLPPPPPPILFDSEPQRFVRNACQHALANLAISILLISSQQPTDDNFKSLRDSDSPQCQSFRQLRSSFEQTRQIYATKPILSADELDMQEDESRTILDLSNLATFGAWLVEGGLTSIAEAHEHFHSVFRGQMSDLAPDVVDLYLALKTQLAIEKLLAKAPEQQADGILNEVLVNGLEDKLRGLHGGFELTAADQSFISSTRSRREALQGEAQNQTDAATVRGKYPTDELIRNFCTHAKSRLVLVSDLGKKLGLSMPASEPSAIDMLPKDPTDGDLDLDDLSSFFEKTTSGLVQNALAGLTEGDAAPAPAPSVETVEQPATEPAKSPPPKAEASTSQTNGKIDFMTDYKELEALVAESTSNYVKTTLHGLSPVPYQPTVPPSTTESMAAQSSYLSQLQQHQAQHPYYTYSQPIPEPPQPQPRPGENLPPNQTFPSAILYDKARQAALSKSSAHTRREGLHSTRRPWTQEEEKALMAGLDMVKGPHWSQILTLFGQNGTISDILKDRTQVQLKDKARNLKLFFLKTNSEMPYYLQAVTGELKTRAPTQAARKEAEERARMNSEEEQARLQGIMTLAGGLQNPPQGRAAGSPVVSSGVVTPAQAASAAQAASSQAGSGTQHGHASHQVHSQASQGYPATSMPQAGPSTQTTAQGLQSGAQAQAPPRPQTQVPPQTPRPHPQHQSPQQQQPQHQHNPIKHSPAQRQQAAQSRSHSSTPVGQPHHSPAPQNTQPSQHSPVAGQPTHVQQSQYAPSQHQPTHQSPPAPVQAQPAPAISHSPTPQPQHDMHDNAAEAALLQGLQAAVAESM